ncbi:hypothetical protein M501DRAFT_927446 [Patellaria atrata CBS 101060]|uniref:Trafficking protein particle complex subunit 11 domain-containing protein n=1 Tax=Patellaria atrata CBS 101060 TaxID=1346257 RepID=A0A9P4SHH3_9PEZI|nr:hypothetical protein M501DRAFT_927446 [Patellaria atrata CBS 101060]
MDAYPADYVAHNLPLIVLYGLSTHEDSQYSSTRSHSPLQDRGAFINSEWPNLKGERAQELLRDFLKADGTNAPWSSKSRTELIGFKFRAVGRSFTLPPRKAAPPARTPDEFPVTQSPLTTIPASWILHSPISPLSPGSPSFPDGIMTPFWLAKHQYFVPSALIAFYELKSDPSKNSLHDNQLKNEISKIKQVLQASEYKTRLVVIVLSDKTVLQAPDLDERLNTIRRGTGLDPKTGLFLLPPNTSRVELSTFVSTVLSALQPGCIEYYRDLTKHSRRKKSRGYAPPPTVPPTRGTSQTLTSQAWAVRYEYKLGVFAEFRQEMDAACRHYSIALDGLLNSDGVFETIASWSPRWDDTRLLTDTIALRILRCLLWNNLPTSAVQAWVDYRDRMQDLIDRRGKGSSNYGWQAWEARWSKIMAETIQRANLPSFNIKDFNRAGDVIGGQAPTFYVPAEKAIPVGERLPPWHLLHHAGYWFELSARHSFARRTLAEDIPEEDRVPPGMSPATQVAHRYGTYDTYLVPQPHIEAALPGVDGYDHTREIVETLEQAVGEFYSRSQHRRVSKLQLDIGTELVRAGRFAEAVAFLKPLWEGMNWRAEHWWSLVYQVASALHTCAVHLREAELVLATCWELYNNALSTDTDQKHDLDHCLDDITYGDDGLGTKIEVDLNAADTSSFLAVSCTFEDSEGHVSNAMKTQLVIRSSAHKNSAPVTLSHIAVQFEGCLNMITISHGPSVTHTALGTPRESIIVNMKIAEGTTANSGGSKLSFSGLTDLTFYPGQIKVLSFPIIFREAGEVRPVGSIITIERERFKLTSSSTFEIVERWPTWWFQSRGGIKTKQLGREKDSPTIIHPKPPKVDLSLPNLRADYFCDEPITLDVEVANHEDEETEAILELQVVGRSKLIPTFTWVSGTHQPSKQNRSESTTSNLSMTELPQHTVGRLAAGETRTASISFTATSQPSDFVLEIKVLYHLLSDPDTPVSKTLSVELVILDLFEANYEFRPRVHPDPWPSYFSVNQGQNGEDGNAVGIAQSWILTARIMSFADETIILEEADLILHAIDGGANCKIKKDDAPIPEAEVSPRDLQEREFDIEVRKLNLEERRPLGLNLDLQVKWRRKVVESGTATPSIVSTLLVPRQIVPSSEPRVLLTTRTSAPSSSVPSVIHLAYTFENPTIHFLTFDMTMEGSEEFAMSGPRLKALHVLPMSRETVRFNVLPLIHGKWINPQLRVVDRYFRQVLKVLAADGCRAEKRGVLIWVDAEKEEDDREET